MTEAGEFPSELQARLDDILRGPPDDRDGALDALGGKYPEFAGELQGLKELYGRVQPADKAPETIGPYRILGLLGEGGMGSVYVASQSQPVRRRVALKLIKLGMDSKAVVVRFEQERQALALMQHDGIAKVFDCGTSERGQPYFVMEYVKGVPITRFCDQNRLDLPARLELFRQVCSAVQHAHQKGVVHRDLKPGNVLVTDEGGKPQPKIIDFGLAKAMGQKLIEASLLTEAGQVVGTPEYMAPEQADPTNADIDTRADIYSLGVMLYELLVGQLPFAGHELRQAGLLGMQRLLRDVEPQKPSTKLSSIGEASSATAAARRISVAALQRALKNDLDWVVLKAMEKDRNRRYDTAAGFAADLQRFLENEPLVAGPPSPAYRLRKLMQRHRNKVAAAGVVVVSLIAGIAGTTYGLLDARTERATAEEAARKARFASYHAGLYAAQAALERASNAEARRLLAECPDEHRGFEWHYLSAQLDPSLLVLRGHAHSVQCACFSPDGRRIVSGSRDETLRIWDTNTGATLAVLRGHIGDVESVAYSPDGRHIVSASIDKTVGIWDAQTHALVRFLTGHDLAVRGIAYSPDGSRIASVSGHALGGSANDATPTMRVWDAQTGAELSVQRCPMPERPLFGNCGPQSVTYTRDGMRVVVAYENGAILAFDPQARETVRVLRAGADHAWTHVASNPSNDWIVSSGQRLQLWSTAAGEKPMEVSRDQGGTTAYSVAFSPDGTRIVSGSTDGTVRLLSATGEKEIATLRGHDDIVLTVACSPDGSRIVSGSQDRTLRVWSAACAMHHDVEALLPLDSIAYNLSGSRILSAGRAGLQIWDSTTLKQICVIRHANARTAVWSPDGTCVATDSENGGVAIWDIGTGQCRKRLESHVKHVSCLAWSPDGALLAAGGLEQENLEVSGLPEKPESKGGSVQVWDVHSGAVLHVLVAPVSHYSRLQFAGDGSRLACTARGGNVARIWDVATTKEVPVLAEGQVWAFDSNGHLVAGKPSAEGFRVCDAATGELRVTLPFAVSEVIYSADGHRILARDTDGLARMLDAPTGRQLFVFKDERFFVAGPSLAIRPDMSQIAFATSSGLRIYLSDVAKSRVMGEAKSARRQATWQVLKQQTSLDRGLESLHRAGLLNNESSFFVFDVARARGDDAAGLEDAAWSLLKTPGNTADTYELAFFRAFLVAALRTDHPVHLLGVAAYRLGAYSSADELLSSPRPSGRTVPIAAAFTAMNTLAREGDESDRAWRERRDFLKLLEVPENRDDPDCQGLATEIDGLFAGVRPRRERAQRLANELLASARSIEAALDQLRSAHEQDQFVERLAAQIIRQRPGALNSQSWRTVKSRGATAQEYEAALALAEQACKLQPENGNILNTLGVAQYRVGRLDEALTTLRRSDAHNSATSKGALPADVAFLAMTLCRLERAEEAARERSRLIELMKNPTHKGDEANQAFLREVEELFRR